MSETVMWDLDKLTIRHGKHDAPNGAVQTCAMEAAYLRWAMRQGWTKHKIVAGWTDRLECVCPVIGGFVRRWNDGISDDADGDRRRTELFTPEVLDLLPDTKGDDALMLQRMWMAIDWDLRTRIPAFLRIAGLTEEAAALASLPELVSRAHLNDARVVAQAAAAGAAARSAARDAAWSAAWDAAGDAARDAARSAAWAAARDAARSAARDAARSAAWDAAWSAAWAAARDAARSAAWDAAGDAAWAAARSAAWDAARDAAGDAAWAAAGDRLAPLVAEMQASARDLLRRMCAVR